MIIAHRIILVPITAALIWCASIGNAKEFTDKRLANSGIVASWNKLLLVTLPIKEKIVITLPDKELVKYYRLSTNYAHVQDSDPLAVITKKDIENQIANIYDRSLHGNRKEVAYTEADEELAIRDFSAALNKTEKSERTSPTKNVTRIEVGELILSFPTDKAARIIRMCRLDGEKKLMITLSDKELIESYRLSVNYDKLTGVGHSTIEMKKTIEERFRKITTAAHVSNRKATKYTKADADLAWDDFFKTVSVAEKNKILPKLTDATTTEIGELILSLPTDKSARIIRMFISLGSGKINNDLYRISEMNNTLVQSQAAANYAIAQSGKAASPPTKRSLYKAPTSTSKNHTYGKMDVIYQKSNTANVQPYYD